MPKKISKQPNQNGKSDNLEKVIEDIIKEDPTISSIKTFDSEGEPLIGEKGGLIQENEKEEDDKTDDKA